MAVQELNGLKPEGDQELDLQIMTVSPELAKQWLASSGGNRPHRQRVIARYADDMKAGRWLLTGDPIGFNEDGALIQGHHRLTACVLAGVPFRTVVAFGLPNDSFMAMDMGTGRTPGDTIGLAVSPRNAVRVAAIARAAYALRGGFTLDTTKVQTIPRRTLVEMVREEQDAFDEAIEVSWETHPMLIQTSVGAVYMATTEKEAYRSFIHAVAEGAGLSVGAPALALRNWAAGLPRAYRNTWVHTSAVINAFNSSLLGQERKLIKPWSPGKKFPELVR